MTHRALLVLVIVAAMATVQLVASFATGPRTSQPTAHVSSTSQSQAPKLTGAGVALADNGSDNGSNDNSDSADNGSNDNSADNGSNDNSADNSDSSDNSSDNGSNDNGSDNGSNDNSSDNGSNDNSSDNSGSNDNSDNSSSSSGDNSSSTGTENPDEIIDNVAASDVAPAATATATRTDAASPAPGAPAAAASPSPVPVTEVSATATGIDSTLALPGNRVAVQIPAAMPQGTTLKLKMVDPLTLPPTAGIRAGDLIFELTATDASGATLTTLPAEVTLTVTYADRDVLGLNEAGITLGHLDPVDNLWKASSRQVANATANTVSSPVTDTGAYAVYVP